MKQRTKSSNQGMVLLLKKKNNTNNPIFIHSNELYDIEEVEEEHDNVEDERLFVGVEDFKMNDLDVTTKINGRLAVKRLSVWQYSIMNGGLELKGGLKLTDNYGKADILTNIDEFRFHTNNTIDDSISTVLSRSDNCSLIKVPGKITLTPFNNVNSNNAATLFYDNNNFYTEFNNCKIRANTNGIFFEKNDNSYKIITTETNTLSIIWDSIPLNKIPVFCLRADATGFAYSNGSNFSIVNDINPYISNNRIVNLLSTNSTNINFNNVLLRSAASPLLSTDVSNKGYVDLQIAILNTNISNQLTIINNTTETNISNINTLQGYFSNNRLNINNISLGSGFLFSDSVNSQYRTLLVNDIPSIPVSKLFDFSPEVLNLLYITPLNLINPPSSHLNLNNKRINNLAIPLNNDDAVSKIYVDSLNQNIYTRLNILESYYSNNYFNISGLEKGIGFLVSDGNSNIYRLLSYNDVPMIDSLKIGDFSLTTQSLINNTPLTSLAPSLTSLNLNSKKIINLANPTLSQDATNKVYVDTFINQLQTQINNLITFQTLVSSYFSNDRLKLSNFSLGSVGVNTFLASNGTSNSFRLLTAADVPTLTTSKFSDFNTAVNNILQTRRLDSFQVPLTSISFGGQLLRDLATPLVSTDGVNKDYTDTQINNLSNTLSSSTTTLQSQIDSNNTNLQSQLTTLNNTIQSQNTSTSSQLQTIQSYFTNNNLKLNNLETGIGFIYSNSSTPVYKVLDSNDIPSILTSKISNFTTQTNSLITSTPLNSIAIPTDNLNLNNQKIVSLKEPEFATDAATKNYVDILVNATTGKIIVSNTATNNITWGDNTVGTWNGSTSTSKTLSGWSPQINPKAFYGLDQFHTFSSNAVLSEDALLHFSDSTGTLRSYIKQSNGALIQVSSEQTKFSIERKDPQNPNKNYLERIMDLGIYTYCYKPGIKEKSNDPISKHHTNSLQVGIIAEEFNSIFNFCGNKPKYHRDFKCEDNNCDICLKQPGAVSYNDLLCYVILGFQDFVLKQNKKNEDFTRMNNNLIDDNISLNKKVSNLEDKLNLLEQKLNKLLESI